MALTKEQLAAREGRLTASRVACLMTGDEEKILNLWREIVGDPSFVAEDLSDVWPIRLGEATEQLQLDWYEKTKNKISNRGTVYVHDEHSWAAATLDGFDTVLKCPVEVKHVGGFEKADVVLQRYMPQIHWQMIVTGTKQCAFSVIAGAREPTVEIIQFDKQYGDELWKRAVAFMEHVHNMTPPVALPAVEAPVKEFKEYDYSHSNSWVSAAGDWKDNKLPAKRFEDAKEALKAQVPRDAQRVFGGGIEATRDKAGRLKIGET